MASFWRVLRSFCCSGKKFTGGCFQEDTHLDSPHCIGICSNYYQKYKNSVLILILNRFVHVVNEWPLRLSDNKVTIDLAQSAAWWCQLIFGTFNQELFHEDRKAIQRVYVSHLHRHAILTLTKDSCKGTISWGIQRPKKLRFFEFSDVTSYFTCLAKYFSWGYVNNSRSQC